MKKQSFIARIIARIFGSGNGNHYHDDARHSKHHHSHHDHHDYHDHHNHHDHHHHYHDHHERYSDYHTHHKDEFVHLKNMPGVLPLSNAEIGEYKFIFAYCPDNDFEHRLLEMGFVPRASISVLERTNVGHASSALIRIKGSTIALNKQIAENILVSKI